MGDLRQFIFITGLQTARDSDQEGEPQASEHLSLQYWWEQGRAFGGKPDTAIYLYWVQHSAQIRTQGLNPLHGLQRNQEWKQQAHAHHWVTRAVFTGHGRTEVSVLMPSGLGT